MLHATLATPSCATVAVILAAASTPPAVSGEPGGGADYCDAPAPATFTVNLPKLGQPPDEEGQGWNLPGVWAGHPGAGGDAIEVPNGRPIYALFISGYLNNAYLDELIFYDFARHLMANGAYVHWAWWNNLLAPYMQRPLHYNQSDPGMNQNLLSFVTVGQAAGKAVPGEDYQFLADAKKMLSAIREHNPEAMIIVAGHSMGGASTIHLAAQADVVIDIVAPIDPVGNRNYPWAGPVLYQNENHFNWTRWRATRDNFKGYKFWDFIEFKGIPPLPVCGPSDQWLKNTNEANDDVLCAGLPLIVHSAQPVMFKKRVINLFHRWQNEAAFPFDFDKNPMFDHNKPPGGTTSQKAVGTLAVGIDPGGWPAVNSGGDCCPVGPGIAWPADGHGEITGRRGPGNPPPLGVRVRTSPQCDGCPGLSWPARTLALGTWGNGAGGQRKALLEGLEQLPLNQTWAHAPDNPGLCLVSQDLIDLFETMNKPPSADAGPDLLAGCDGCGTAIVGLDGSASTDPDNGDDLDYTWSSDFGSAEGEMAELELPLGVHCIQLEVEDPAGHISRDSVRVTVSDTATGILPYASQAQLWAAAHPTAEAYAFDAFYPGVAGASPCLVMPVGDPGVLPLAGGTITLSASIDGEPDCAVSDSSNEPAVSDGKLAPGAVLVLDFDPPVTAFYSYYGSLQAGHSVTMALHADPDGPPVALLESPVSATNPDAAGHGFTSATPIARAVFTSTAPNKTVLGAFLGLLPGEPSLGTIDIPGYPGPDGSTIELDFACIFAPPVPACPGDANGDGAVDSLDLNEVLAGFGTPGPSGDVNADGAVDSLDLNLVLAGFGAPC